MDGAITKSVRMDIKIIRVFIQQDDCNGLDGRGDDQDFPDLQDCQDFN